MPYQRSNPKGKHCVNTSPSVLVLRSVFRGAFLEPLGCLLLSFNERGRYLIDVNNADSFFPMCQCNPVCSQSRVHFETWERFAVDSLCKTGGNLKCFAAVHSHGFYLRCYLFSFVDCYQHSLVVTRVFRRCLLSSLFSSYVTLFFRKRGSTLVRKSKGNFCERSNKCVLMYLVPEDDQNMQQNQHKRLEGWLFTEVSGLMQRTRGPPPCE